MAPTIPIKINNSIILLDNVSQILYDVNMKGKRNMNYYEQQSTAEYYDLEYGNKLEKYYLNICPICDQETHYDQWAKPQVACINCGIEE